jgi:uncharacterized protein (DUF4415 family)
MKNARRNETLEDVWDAEDVPATDEMLARLAPMPQDTKEAFRRARGAQKAPTKQLVSLRLDRDVLEHFRASGEGWQSRLNAALRKAAGL